MKLIATAVLMMSVAAVTVAGHAIAPYAAAPGYVEHAIHDTAAVAGAYYGAHYAPHGYALSGFAAPYASYYGNPSGTYSYWGEHGPTVVQENAASLHGPVAAHHLYAPYSPTFYDHHGLGKPTIVQANVAASLANHWGYPSAYGAYGHGYGYDYNKYLL
ncbi:uncharacterized protein LOC128723849 [Anopheles nili]|uniref:uncharacterized protein LOC128723849 n=1 Tax=Anopheles nili TaxID=185578 RepID=UPI00237A8B07|nr:uncharacterized protein LOC128723849 [Anopheles nili]